jgi:nucleoside-diphosphate-sugar epimerase
MSEKILVTGGCGFVGSHLAINLKTKYPSYEVVAMDNLKRRGSELNIPRLKDNGFMDRVDCMILSTDNYIQQIANEMGIKERKLIYENNKFKNEIKNKLK